MQVLVVCLWLLSSALSGQSQDTQVINSLIDDILKETNSMILQNGFDQIALPNVTETFKKKVAFVTVKGSFVASEGWFKNLSTIERTGDVTLSTTTTTLVLNLNLGLGTAAFGFAHYKAKFLGIGPSGEIDMKVGNNSLDCQISLFYNGTHCKSTVDSASVVTLSGVKVHATGLGKLNFLLDKIADWVIKKFNEEIKGMIEENLQATLSTALTKMDLCWNIVKLLFSSM